MNESTPATPATLPGMATPGPALSPEAQAALAEEVRIFQAHLEAGPDIFRRMLSLAHHYRLTPAEFRSHLMRAGLKAPRASELKQVLSAKDQCDAFLGASRQPWKLTLKLSRLQQIEKEFGLTPAHLLAGRVAGLLSKSGVPWLVVAGGLLTLDIQPTDLHSASISAN